MNAHASFIVGILILSDMSHVTNSFRQEMLKAVECPLLSHYSVIIKNLAPNTSEQQAAHQILQLSHAVS